MPINIQKPVCDDKSVLITGASGFFGKWLLNQYLESDVYQQVFVLVRNVASFRFSHPKLVVLKADLALDQFGLNDCDYKLLTNNVTEVLHNAANVNWIKDFFQLYDDNVKATVNIVKMCNLCKFNVQIKFISTTAVYDNAYHAQQHFIIENQQMPQEHWNSIKGGYAQSKFISELVIQHSGFDFIIFRTNFLICDTAEFKWLDRDFLVRLLKSCKFSKSTPNIDMNLYLLPVDIAAEYVFLFNDYNRVVNLVGKSITLKQYCSFVANSVCPFDKWISTVSDEISVFKEFFSDESCSFIYDVSSMHSIDQRHSLQLLYECLFL
jgi:thioester reductase-like protein